MDKEKKALEELKQLIRDAINKRELTAVATSVSEKETKRMGKAIGEEKEDETVAAVEVKEGNIPPQTSAETTATTPSAETTATPPSPSQEIQELKAVAEEKEEEKVAAVEVNEGNIPSQTSAGTTAATPSAQTTATLPPPSQEIQEGKAVAEEEEEKLAAVEVESAQTTLLPETQEEKAEVENKEENIPSPPSAQIAGTSSAQTTPLPETQETQEEKAEVEKKEANIPSPPSAQIAGTSSAQTTPLPETQEEKAEVERKEANIPSPPSAQIAGSLSVQTTTIPSPEILAAEKEKVASVEVEVKKQENAPPAQNTATPSQSPDIQEEKAVVEEKGKKKIASIEVEVKKEAHTAATPSTRTTAIPSPEIQELKDTSSLSAEEIQEVKETSSRTVAEKNDEGKLAAVKVEVEEEKNIPSPRIAQTVATPSPEIEEVKEGCSQLEAKDKEAAIPSAQTLTTPSSEIQEVKEASSQSDEAQEVKEASSGVVAKEKEEEKLAAVEAKFEEENTPLPGSAQVIATPSAQTPTTRSPEIQEVKEASSQSNEAESQVVQPKEEVSIWGIPLLADERSDAILLKFLRARDFKVKEAFAMIKDTLQWRKEFEVENLLDEEFGDQFEKHIFMFGVDREGHPICYNVCGAFADKEFYLSTLGTKKRRDKFLRWRIQFIEKNIRNLDFSPNGICTMVQVNDLKKSSSVSDTMELEEVSNQALKLLQDNYPEFIEKQVCINVPRWYVYLRMMIKPFLSRRYKSNFVFADDSKYVNTLFKYVAPEQVPVQYGGLGKEDDEDFTINDAVTEVTIKPAVEHIIELPISEGCILVWELVFRHQGKFIYSATFDSSAKAVKTPIFPDEREMEVARGDRVMIRDRFKNESGVPGNVVIHINNQKKKKQILYRYKMKPHLD